MKKEIKKPKYNCKKDGHVYVVMDDYPTDNDGELSGTHILLECSKCGVRKQLKSRLGYIDLVIEMWQSKEINNEERIKLVNILEKTWKKWQEKRRLKNKRKWFRK